MYSIVYTTHTYDWVGYFDCPLQYSGHWTACVSVAELHLPVIGFHMIVHLSCMKVGWGGGGGRGDKKELLAWGWYEYFSLGGGGGEGDHVIGEFCLGGGVGEEPKHTV